MNKKVVKYSAEYYDFNGHIHRVDIDPTMQARLKFIKFIKKIKPPENFDNFYSIGVIYGKNKNDEYLCEYVIKVNGKVVYTKY